MTSSSPGANTAPTALRRGTGPNPQSADRVPVHVSFSQVRISSILPRTKTARLRLSSGGIRGRRLIHKFVKPVKVARSCDADEICVDQLLVVKTKP